MAANVITALRHDRRLKGNLKFTAIEIGHLMNTQGFSRVAYQMMAHKTGSSTRTVIRHMHKLVALDIFRKTIYRLKFGNQINLYKCLLPLPAYYRSLASNAKCDTSSMTLPTSRGEEEKSLSLGEELERLRKGLRFLSNPDTPMYQACVEKIAALEALQRTQRSER